MSLTVPSRRQVALVGTSGAGKSTLFALVARFYEPDAGTLSFDGVPAAELGRSDCRARIAVVDQNTRVVHGTLWDNITYGAPDAGEAEVRRVVDLARLGAVVERLPGGLRGAVGERGATLSGGERQRVALARALLTRPSCSCRAGAPTGGGGGRLPRYPHRPGRNRRLPFIAPLKGRHRVAKQGETGAFSSHSSWVSAQVGTA
ncbi:MULTISPECIES: ATP-binding cassette domain-containing protein [Streptomyces]|uniref:ATP-binding cassette domain-containing protein n=1 Tax=Streptomyces TaxID=1883 RepID=UPI0027D34518|nr:ATP-binding cassette domain-containing protein [Streptomyces changanensis]